MLIMKKKILSFLLILILSFTTSINVFATSGGGVSRDDLENWDNWTFEEKYQYYAVGALDLAGAVVGCFMHGDSNALYLSYLRTVWDDLSVEDMSFEEWVAMRLGYDSETDEISVDNELVDLMYSACVTYIEENTGYIITKTADSKTLFKEYVQSFTTYSQYSTLLEYIEQNPDCIFWFADNLRFSNRLDPNDNSITYSSAISFYVIELKNTDLIAEYYAYAKSYYVSPYDKNWQSLKLKQYCIDDSGELHSLTEYAPRVAMFLQGKDPNNPYYRYYSYETPPIIDGVTNIVLNLTGTGFFVSHGEKELRIYKSLDYLKQYSIDSRPYYITNDFSNYDSTIDNSTTITQTEIDNSVTYGDVYNYITNNYENPDGLTEDELRAILEEYLSSINNSGGSGGSGGSSDDSGGSGLSGFLDGLGSIGNAILAILGKLMEILGSAIELVTGSITDLITIIPNSVGELLGALFPVFPEEWIKAITLSLVLGVIVGIVRMFK